jgi:IS1 family transposase/DNA-binding HxlR family transcriptional regulator
MSTLFSASSLVHTFCPYHRPLDLVTQEHPKITLTRKEKFQRFCCKKCGTRYTRLTNTAMTHLKTAPSKIAQTLKGLAKGLGIRATADLFQVKPKTVQRWLFRAAIQGEYVMSTFFRNLPPSYLQMDELWTYIVQSHEKQPKHMRPLKTDAWIWVALLVPSRLIVAVHVGKRTLEDANRFIQKVFARITFQTTLWTSDALSHYKTALLHNYTTHGIHPKETKEQVMYGHVIKIRQHRTVTHVETKLIWGNPQETQNLLKKLGQQTINTAYVERVNLTLRQEIQKLQRRTLGHAKTWQGLQMHLSFHVAYYNFCRFHSSLRTELSPEEQINGKKWHPRTPAIVAGVTDHCWSLEELLLFQTPFAYDPFPVRNYMKGPVKKRLVVSCSKKKRIKPQQPSIYSNPPISASQSSLIDVNLTKRTQISNVLMKAPFSSSKEKLATLIQAYPLPYLKIHYKDREGRVTDRIILPERLEEDFNHIYLIAFCTLRKKTRNFRLDRILGYEVTSPPQESENYDKKENLSQKRTSLLKSPAIRRVLNARTKKSADPDKKEELSSQSPKNTSSVETREEPPPFEGGQPDILLDNLSDKYALLIWQFLFWMHPHPQQLLEICEGTGLHPDIISKTLTRLINYGLVRLQIVKKGSVRRRRPKHLYWLIEDTLDALRDPL